MDDVHSVFKKLNMEKLSSSNVDQIIKDQQGLKILFLWGNNCPNCEVAKNILDQEFEAVVAMPFKWYHCNIYEDFDLSTRFGLHGIPVFLFYSDNKSLGRMTSFPGFDAFMNVLNQVIEKSKRQNG